MNRTKLQSLIKLLQGAITSASFVGASYIFYEYFFINFMYAFSFSFLFFLFSVFWIVVLEYLSIKIEILKETKEQTQILKEIKTKLDKL